MTRLRLRWFSTVFPGIAIAKGNASHKTMSSSTTTPSTNRANRVFRTFQLAKIFVFCCASTGRTSTVRGQTQVRMEYHYDNCLDPNIGDYPFAGGYMEAFVGDAWKIRPNLTVNFGLRYLRDTGRWDSDLAPHTVFGGDFAWLFHAEVYQVLSDRI